MFNTCLSFELIQFFIQMTWFVFKLTTKNDQLLIGLSTTKYNKSFLKTKMEQINMNNSIPAKMSVKKSGSLKNFRPREGNFSWAPDEFDIK